MLTYTHIMSAQPMKRKFLDTNVYINYIIQSLYKMTIKQLLAMAVNFQLDVSTIFLREILKCKIESLQKVHIMMSGCRRAFWNSDFGIHLELLTTILSKHFTGGHLNIISAILNFYPTILIAIIFCHIERCFSPS